MPPPKRALVRRGIPPTWLIRNMMSAVVKQEGWAHRRQGLSAERSVAMDLECHFKLESAVVAVKTRTAKFLALLTCVGIGILLGAGAITY